MKKKILVIILVVLIVLLIIFMIVKPKFNFKKSDKDTSRNFILDSDSYGEVNKSGENSGIYVGVNEENNDNFIFLSIKINKKVSKEEQVKALISEVSTATGYKIDINSVKIDGEKIIIDFSKTAAPFELEESYNQTDSQKYYITSDSLVAKTLFDSINKTLKSYFGDTTEVYFSADNENINIENDILTINIDKDVKY